MGTRKLADVPAWLEVQAGKVQEGLEIAWQFQAPHGLVRVHIRRRPGVRPSAAGPPAMPARGSPGAGVIRAEEGRRLVAEQEGVATRRARPTCRPSLRRSS